MTTNSGVSGSADQYAFDASWSTCAFRCLAWAASRASRTASSAEDAASR